MLHNLARYSIGAADSLFSFLFLLLDRQMHTDIDIIQDRVLRHLLNCQPQLIIEIYCVMAKKKKASPQLIRHL